MTAPTPEDPPFVDEHAVEVEAPAGTVWAALEAYARDSLRLGPRHPLGLLLGTEPRAGFAEVARDPGRQLGLAGRHRFSRYRLTFVLTERGGATRLAARTHAAFPGIHGRLYRAAVIGSGAHAVATRGILRAVRRRALAAADR